MGWWTPPWCRTTPCSVRKRYTTVRKYKKDTKCRNSQIHKNTETENNLDLTVGG